MSPDNVYVLKGLSASEQAESSSANPMASDLQMRILIELQVISMLLAANTGQLSEDLRQLRQNAADSIT